jgi:hypothetical protein
MMMMISQVNHTSSIGKDFKNQKEIIRTAAQNVVVRFSAVSGLRYKQSFTCHLISSSPYFTTSLSVGSFAIAFAYSFANALANGKQSKNSALNVINAEESSLRQLIC